MATKKPKTQEKPKKTEAAELIPEQKAAAEAKAAAAAQREVEKAAKAAAKEKAEKEKAAKLKEANRLLDPKAKTIVALLRSADKADKAGDDKRLSAALELAAAEKTATEMGLSFKKWFDENIGVANLNTSEDKNAPPKLISYDEARKLVSVGKSENPPQALADLRAGNAARNKKAREKKKAAEGASSGGRRTAPADAPVVVAIDNLKRVDEPKRLEVITEQARDMGFVVAPAGDGLGPIKAMFGNLKAQDKVEFLKWAGAETGMIVSDPFSASHQRERTTDENLPDPPAALQRGVTQTAPAA